LPLLVPYAVRDPQARANKRSGIPESWGSPNREGYFKDDNTLIKAIPRSLRIESSFGFYAGRRLGPGFTAAHVWQLHADETRATRHPLTYSFVPNLVWLPKQVALLTDRTGSFVEAYLQAVAVKLYRHVTVAPRHEKLVAEAWELLPPPSNIPEQGVPAAGALNFFAATPAFFATRSRAIRQVRDLLSSVLGERDDAPEVSRRYNAQISTVSDGKVRALREFLSIYLGDHDYFVPDGRRPSQR
jgi:hypothetical protein